MESKDFFSKRIRELSQTCSIREVVTFSDFLNISEQEEVAYCLKKGSGVKAAFFGGYEEAERKICAFYPQWMEIPQGEEYPFACIFYRIKGGRFAPELSHRDYLGALLHLGVDRSLIGDILVKEDGAYVFCLEKMAEYFLDNLTQVRNTGVEGKMITNLKDLPKPGIQTLKGTVASVRLDTLLALAYPESRTKLVKAIESGQVFVNGSQVLSNSYAPQEGDIISYRGHGRFRLLGKEGVSRKGRLYVSLGVYV